MEVSPVFPELLVFMHRFSLDQPRLYSLPHFLQNALFCLAELSLFLQAQLNCNIRSVVCTM